MKWWSPRVLIPGLCVEPQITVAQYVNTAVLDMLANVKARSAASDALFAKAHFANRFLNGKYKDFTNDW